MAASTSGGQLRDEKGRFQGDWTAMGGGIVPKKVRTPYESKLSDEEIRAYQRLAGHAIKEWIQIGVKIVAKRVRRNAPVGDPHRASSRVYQSGMRYHPGTEEIIRKSVRSRVIGNNFTKITGIVRSTVGYSAFQELGWQPKTPGGRTVGPRVTGLNFMIKSRDESMPDLLKALAGKWPK